jgi:SOS-response transcriptional repressor LexA
MTTTTDTRPRITDRQRAVYDIICARYAETGIGLGVREISAAMGFASPTGSMCHLKYLEKRGYVRKLPGRANSIVPILEG